MVKIDKDKCIGCGVCAQICPQGFAMAGRLAQVKDTQADCVSQAAQSCPVNAIVVDDEFNKDNNLGRAENNSDINQEENGPKGFGFGRAKGRGFGFGKGRGRGRGRGLGFGFGRRHRGGWQ